MLFDRLLRKRPARAAGRALYACVVEQARSPALYTEFGVPDTVEGRFEIYTLHVVLLLDRLKRQGQAAAETAQGLFDTYVAQLDHALRELGVGDLSVGKKMRRLGEAFYGRVKSYEQALAALPVTAELETVLGRTIYEASPATAPGPLASYVVVQRDALAAQPLEGLLAGQASWGSL